MNQITKIVISGGPCGGKSCALEYIRNVFSKKGYQVLLIPESATQLILGGITPLTCRSALEYQIFQSRLQLTKEKIYDEMASSLQSDVLIVCDRGLMDAKAYMSEAEFDKMVNILKEDKEEWMHRYDAIFFLETTAKGAEECYSACNNKARSEGIQEARRLDDLTIQAWKDHPYYFQFDNSTDFDGKLKKLENAIENFLTCDKVSL